MKNKYILAIDTGNVESGYCLIDKETYKPVEFGKISNEQMLMKVIELEYSELVLEMVASYGMPVGSSIFETCVWIGRFIQARNCPDYEYIYRKEEKLNLCNSMKAKDSNIRQALIDRFGEVGTKKRQGFFYGFKKDVWSAFAVGCTYLDKKKETI
jgi:hypothetical protein